MKVIFLKDIKGVGRLYEVKDVSDGYARNYLLPNRLAKIADEKSLRALEKERALHERQEAEFTANAREVAKELSDKIFAVALKTNKNGSVFGSVTKEMIKDLVASDTARISKDDIDVLLEKPIRALGEHRVQIDLGRGVKTTITLSVQPQP